MARTVSDIRIKRVYDPPGKDDGVCVLVDRPADGQAPAVANDVRHFDRRLALFEKTARKVCLPKARTIS